jgi:D,D-heptose 1,7-bisphosphate phosphatase
MPNKAVFLDRDGTIARNVSYCSRPEDFELLPTVPEAIRLLNNGGFKVVVITNQSGIARSYFTTDTLAQIHEKMKTELERYGARIDAIYYCPHHPDADCDCRKPNTALFQQAASEYDIDLGHSFMVGDTDLDIAAGKALGCKTVLVTTGPNGSSMVNSPDHVADRLLDTVHWILKQSATKTISIVIPALNEKEAITNTIKAVARNRLEEMGYETQILVVDNGSTDGTGELAKEAGADVILEPRRGYGRAYKTGFANARGSIIATADADLAYPIEEIPRLLQILEEQNLDFITTNRYARMSHDAMSPLKKIGNGILNLVTRFLFHTDIKDSQSGMWVFRKNILDRMQLKYDTMAFSEELKLEACYFLKCNWKEIPIEYRSRVGQAKLRSWQDGFGNLFRLIMKRLLR